MVGVRVQLLLDLVDHAFEEYVALNDDRLSTPTPSLLVVRDHAGHGLKEVSIGTAALLRAHVEPLKIQRILLDQLIICAFLALQWFDLDAVLAGHARELGLTLLVLRLELDKLAPFFAVDLFLRGHVV